jgi:hypothetical protein
VIGDELPKWRERDRVRKRFLRWMRKGALLHGA